MRRDWRTGSSAAKTRVWRVFYVFSHDASLFYGTDQGKVFPVIWFAI